MSRHLYRILAVGLMAGSLAACGGSTEPSNAEGDAALPDDVTAFVARAGECRSWSDEARASGPHADATREEVMAAWTENACETLGADAGTLRQTHADDSAAIAAIDGAMTPVEGAAVPNSPPAAATPEMGEEGLARFISKAEQCAGFAGEAGDDAEQNTRLEGLWSEAGCQYLQAETNATRQAYAGNDAVLARVNESVAALGY
ncbi:hypothetical protein [Brevundimonas bacteroides]|uniref:hypothetical protein n=1 Tax=Brevundimonas bacteroides TaxID=74311 RepID=UPI000497C203|nr:hypothetical protein [Brevundimonas bacteroides]